MGNLHLVTGYAGKEHVTSEDIGSFNVAIVGSGEFVLNRGTQFAASVISNSQIRVGDGDIILQGRHIRLNEGSYVDLTIENGSQDMKRNDLIVVRYSKDSITTVESADLVVIKGIAAASNPADPAYNTGDIINDHVLIKDMPLYRVPLDGLNVQELVPLFSTIGNSKSVTATLTASGWVGSSAPYTQTVSVTGMTSSFIPGVPTVVPEASVTNDEIISQSEALGCINMIKSSSGTLTFVCAEDKPSIDLTVCVPGVM